MNYDVEVFSNYVRKVIREMEKRNIKFQHKYVDEFISFCNNDLWICENYPEHNDRYLKQCYYNLQEKLDRGIITQKEWNLIEKNFHNRIHQF